MKLLHTLILVITLLVIYPSLYAQGSRKDDVVFRNGVGLGGVNVSVCAPLATTAASVTSNIATYTMLTNPQTAGFVAGMQVQVAGFTGGDTYFNAGTVANNTMTGGQIILSVTSTTINTTLSHANASASSNGTILQLGNNTTSCAGLVSLFADQLLSVPVSNPVLSDGFGNFGFWSAPGNYYVQYYGATVTTTLKYATVPSAGTNIFTGSVSAGQIVYASALNVFTGSANFQYGTPVANALNLNMPTTSCPTFPSCAPLVITNTGGTLATYFIKKSDNSFFITQDPNSIPTHGWIGFDANGNFSVTAGNTGANFQAWATTGAFPQGSVTEFCPPNGLLTSVYAINSPTGLTGAASLSWNCSSGLLQLYPNNATSPTATFTPPATGLSTIMSAVQCGVIAAGGACANTATTQAHCVSGIATLGGGTSTITGISPAFTNSSSWFVITNDVTTITNASKGVPASGSSITFTGTGTDNIQFIGCGG